MAKQRAEIFGSPDRALTVGEPIDALATYPRRSRVLIWATATKDSVAAMNRMRESGKRPKELMPMLTQVVGLMRTGTNKDTPELETSECLELITLQQELDRRSK